MRTIKNIVITGASGYIGANLARRLVLDGYNIHIIIRPNSNLHLISDIKDRINIHVFNGDTAELINIFKKAKPEVVFHLAALFIAEHKTEDVFHLINSNVLFGTQLLEAAAISGVLYFINTGTHWQNYQDEEYNPVNLYAATKQALETIAKYYLETSEMRMLTVKLVDTYGPFDPRSKVISLFKRVVQTGELLEMSPGEQEVGLVYIDDVIKGLLDALEYVNKLQPHQQESCILGPKRVYKLKEVARIFSEISGVPLNISWGKKNYRKREMMKVYKKEFNILHHEAINLKKGIKMLLEIEKGQ